MYSNFKRPNLQNDISWLHQFFVRPNIKIYETFFYLKLVGIRTPVYNRFTYDVIQC